MSATFICWPLEQDTAFRAAWAGVFGARLLLEEFPEQSASHYMVASELIAQSDIDALLAANVGAQIFAARPTNWVPADEEG